MRKLLIISLAASLTAAVFACSKPTITNDIDNIIYTEQPAPTPSPTGVPEPTRRPYAMPDPAWDSAAELTPEPGSLGGYSFKLDTPRPERT